LVSILITNLEQNSDWHFQLKGKPNYPPHLTLTVLHFLNAPKKVDILLFGIKGKLGLI
jgi:hypothetical protein